MALCFTPSCHNPPLKLSPTLKKKLGIGSPVFCTFPFAPPPPPTQQPWPLKSEGKTEEEKVGGVHWLIVTSVRVQCTAFSSLTLDREQKWIFTFNSCLYFHHSSFRKSVTFLSWKLIQCWKYVPPFHLFDHGWWSLLSLLTAFLSFFLYILPDPLSSIIGRCTLYTTVAGLDLLDFIERRMMLKTNVSHVHSIRK